MKKVLIAAVALMLASGAMATEQKSAHGTTGQAENNLLVALASENTGLQESAAFMLGEMSSERAVIPLMRMLRSEHQSSRIVAALALCRIGDARGVYAVKRASRFDDNAQVRQRCAWFYEQYVTPGSFAFSAPAKDKPEHLASR